MTEKQVDIFLSTGHPHAFFLPASLQLGSDGKLFVKWLKFCNIWFSFLTYILNPGNFLPTLWISLEISCAFLYFISVVTHTVFFATRAFLAFFVYFFFFFLFFFASTSDEKILYYPQNCNSSESTAVLSRGRAKSHKHFTGTKMT